MRIFVSILTFYKYTDKVLVNVLHVNKGENMEHTIQELQGLIPPEVKVTLALKGWENKYLPIGQSVIHAINNANDCGSATEDGDWVEFQQTQGDIQGIVYRAHVPCWVFLKIFFISILPWYRSVYDLKRRVMVDNAGFSFVLKAKFKSVELKDCKVVNQKGIWKMLVKTA